MHLFAGHRATGKWATPVTCLLAEDLSRSHSESFLRSHNRSLTTPWPSCSEGITPSFHPTYRPATMPPISVQGTAISGSRKNKVLDRPTSLPPSSRRQPLSATPSARRHTLSATPSAMRHTLRDTRTPHRGFLQRNHTVTVEAPERFPCRPQVSFSDPQQ